MVAKKKLTGEEKTKAREVKQAKQREDMIEIPDDILDEGVRAEKEVIRLTNHIEGRIMFHTEDQYTQSSPNSEFGYDAEKLGWSLFDASKRFPDSHAHLSNPFRLASAAVRLGVPYSMYPYEDRFYLPGPMIRMGSFKHFFRQAVSKDLAQSIYNVDPETKTGAMVRELMARGGNQLSRIGSARRAGDIHKVLTANPASAFGVVLFNDFRGKATIEIDSEAKLTEKSQERMLFHPGFGFEFRAMMRSTSEQDIWNVLEREYESYLDNDPKLRDSVEKTSLFGYPMIAAHLTFAAKFRFRAGMPETIALFALNKLIEGAALTTENGYGAHRTDGCGRMNVWVEQKQPDGTYQKVEPLMDWFTKEAQTKVFQRIAPTFISLIEKSRPQPSKAD